MRKPTYPQTRVRLPGLYRRWELGTILEPGTDYHIEVAGETREGTLLIAIFRCIGEDEAAAHA